MKVIDKDKKVWFLRDSRPYGPFPVHLVGQDHAVLRVPGDKRLWVDADRVPEYRFTKLEIAPVSCLTHDEAEAKAWRERNEPRVGDLVSVLTTEWNRKKRGQNVRVEVTVEGVIGRVTDHQVQLFQVRSASVDDDTRSPRFFNYRGGTLTGNVTKDSCIIIERGISATDEWEG